MTLVQLAVAVGAPVVVGVVAMFVRAYLRGLFYERDL